MSDLALRPLDAADRADLLVRFRAAPVEHCFLLTQLEQNGLTGFLGMGRPLRAGALVRPGLDVSSATLLDRMLAADVKLGTSTPRADPSGDYAWEVFRKADKLKPGAFAALGTKALQLVGGPTSPTAPLGRALSTEC